MIKLLNRFAGSGNTGHIWAERETQVQKLPIVDAAARMDSFIDALRSSWGMRAKMLPYDLGHGERETRGLACRFSEDH